MEAKLNPDGIFVRNLKKAHQAEQQLLPLQAAENAGHQMPLQGFQGRARL